MGHGWQAAHALHRTCLMRACGLIAALLATGCLAVPPDPVVDGDDGADGDDGYPDSDGGAACAEGSQLDLVWVSEVAFDHEEQDQVTLPGLLILVNPGLHPIELDDLRVVPPAGAGPVEAELSLTGGGLSLPPGEAMGALNIGATIALDEFDEEWTNLELPQLDAVLRFDESADDTEVPLRLELGPYSFDLSILVLVEPGAGSFDWARAARRTSAFCEE
jgi:hypothetical protein